MANLIHSLKLKAAVPDRSKQKNELVYQSLE